MAGDRTFRTMRDWGARGLRGGASTMSGFQKFILRGNVVDMAVGIVIGAAFTTVVQGFVKDFITPLIGLFVGLLNGAAGANVQDFAQRAQFHGFMYGDFISDVLAFLIVAFVVYFFVVRPVTVFQDRFTRHEEAAPQTRACPFCLSTVNLKATRCAFCTAQLPPVEEQDAQAPSTP
jgi:large conductance mechanosensitive channel